VGALLTDLAQVAAIDQHAHNVVRAELADSWPFARSFSEAHDEGMIETHARQTLFFRRSLRDVGELLGCDPDELAIVSRRREMGLEVLTEHCFRAANLRAVLLDDGFLADATLPVSWHAQYLPARRVVRIETLAEGLIRTCDRFDEFEDRFRASLDPLPAGTVAIKSIACYRTGLDVRPVERAVARERFLLLKRRVGSGPLRLADKELVDYLFAVMLGCAARRGTPVQLHTGFGDSDLDLRLSNPLHLRGLLEDPKYRGAPLVLLHASYPFVREAGYLASVYPQVYLDMGLAVAFLSISGMREAVRQLVELAPASKVMYSSDAHFIPETFYLSAKWGRRVLAEVLEGGVADGDLTANEAEEFGRLILAENARKLYRLDGLAR
jgi:hypothetical protein